MPVTSKPLKYIVAPTDADFCNITLAGVADMQVHLSPSRTRAQHTHVRPCRAARA